MLSMSNIGGKLREVDYCISFYKGKVLLHVGLCGSKKKEIYIEGLCALHITRWTLYTCHFLFTATYPYMQQNFSLL